MEFIVTDIKKKHFKTLKTFKIDNTPQVKIILAMFLYLFIHSL